MLSTRHYAKYFGENLLKDIFHLDAELQQARANKQDPLVEEELERSMEAALSEAELTGEQILEDAKKPKYHVYSVLGGACLSSHTTESAAHKSAANLSYKQPVHVWEADGEEIKIPIARYHNGHIVESFEASIHDIMNEMLQESNYDWTYVKAAETPQKKTCTSGAALTVKGILRTK